MAENKTTRKLEILEGTELAENGMNSIKVPAVLSMTTKDSDEPRETLIYGVLIPEPWPDGTVDLGLVMYDGVVSSYMLKSSDDLEVDKDAGVINFSVYGNKYTIRAIEDKDSSWILDDPQQTATAEELEGLATTRAELGMEIQ